MSKLDELIKKYCPDGVEYKSLGDICECIRGKSLCKDDIGTGNQPVILYGELYTTYGDYINDVVSKVDKINADNSPRIEKGDLILPISSTTKEAQIGKVSVFNTNIDTRLGSDAVILRHKQCPGYLLHLLNSKDFEVKKMRCVKGTTISHLHPSEMLDIEIPVPPLPVQEEIVRILDKFTLLTAELTARKKQYEYYRDYLIDEDIKDNNNVVWKRLEDICEVSVGTKPKEIYENRIEYEYINAGTTNSGYVKEYNCDGDTITTPLRGQGGIGYIGYQFKDFWLGPLCYKIKSNVNFIKTRYVYYYLKSHNNLIYELKKEGGVPAINRADLVNIKIPHIDIISKRKLSEFSTALMLSATT